MPQVYSGDNDIQPIGGRDDVAVRGSSGRATMIALLKGLLAEMGDEEGDSDLLTELRAIRIGIECANSVDVGTYRDMAAAMAVD